MKFLDMVNKAETEISYKFAARLNSYQPNSDLNQFSDQLTKSNDGKNWALFSKPLRTLHVLLRASNTNRSLFKSRSPHLQF